MREGSGAGATQGLEGPGRLVRPAQVSALSRPPRADGVKKRVFRCRSVPGGLFASIRLGETRQKTAGSRFSSAGGRSHRTASRPCKRRTRPRPRPGGGHWGRHRVFRVSRVRIHRSSEMVAGRPAPCTQRKTFGPVTGRSGPDTCKLTQKTRRVKRGVRRRGTSPVSHCRLSGYGWAPRGWGRRPLWNTSGKRVENRRGTLSNATLSTPRGPMGTPRGGLPRPPRAGGGQPVAAA